jgi:hypothetical protein
LLAKFNSILLVDSQVLWRNMTFNHFPIIPIQNTMNSVL